MYKTSEILVVFILLLVLIYAYNLKYHIDFNTIHNTKKEGFRSGTQNFVYTNYNDIAQNLEYGRLPEKELFENKNTGVSGPSSNNGVNQNNSVDVMDNRGFKWTTNAKDPEVDIFTNTVDNLELRKKFERTYMLDPNGDTAKYDISSKKISANCCPAQFSPPFKLTDKDGSNCDFAQKYVANNYSGMNYQDGYGCVCMTPEDANFVGSRGGNSAPPS
jgi:hypothetical protein